MGEKIEDGIGGYFISDENLEISIQNMYQDLNKLTRALEIYLGNFINCIENISKRDEIQNLGIDYVISFNYTNTYERVYGQLPSGNIDYLHGRARFHSNIDDCNLVLGIDEYLTPPDCDINNEFIWFKKFFQRIYKKTGCLYLKWIEQCNMNPSYRNNNSTNENHLYIFGHSLDITDKDVLSRLICMEGMRTTIYYHDKQAYAKQIANLVKVLGEEKLIEMVHGNRPTIVFLPQG